MRACLDAHGVQSALQSSLKGGKGQAGLGHQTGLLQEDPAVAQGHPVEEAGHLIPCTPEALRSCWMLSCLDPAELPSGDKRPGMLQTLPALRLLALFLLGAHVEGPIESEWIDH